MKQIYAYCDEKDGTLAFRVVDQITLEDLRYAAPKSGMVEMYRGNIELTLWMDEQGRLHGEQFFSKLSSELSDRPHEGPLIITGGEDEEGHTTGLSSTQIAHIISKWQEIIRKDKA